MIRNDRSVKSLPSDEEVLWLDVSVYQMLGVDVFYPHQKLNGYQEHRLDKRKITPR